MGRGKPEKYFELTEKIRLLIQERKMKRRDILPSERQLATMFGVNHLTLRKALRILEQEKVIYKEPSRGNYVGPKPSSGKGRKFIGFIIPDEEVFYHNILVELEEKLASSGLHPVVHITRNSKKREEEILDFGAEEELGAIVAVPNPECVEKYRQMQIPLIFFDTYLDGIDAPHIISDDCKGAAMSTQHLLSLGHTAIAYIGSGYDRSMQLRLKGLSDTLRKAGIEPQPQYMKAREATREWGALAAEELFQLPKPPTAILCGNDTIAAGALRQLSENGVEVPRQCSIIGFGNTAVAEDLDLTSVNQHTSKIAASLWNLLCMAIKGDVPPPETVIPTSIVLRGSTGKAP